MKADRGRPSIRLPAILFAGLILIAAALGYRSKRRPAGPTVPLIARVRGQLALAPVLAAEAALQARADDPRLRLRLADACAGTGDPAGAALALYPLVESPAARLHSPELVAPFILYCAQVGWWEEAAAILPRRGGEFQQLLNEAAGSASREAASTVSAPVTLPRAILELASACAAHGEAPCAVSLLTALDQGARGELGGDEWLDGAMTWYQCRRPQEASEWARRGAAKEPENPAARAVLARCLLAAGRPEAALSALPDHPLTHHPLRGYPPPHPLIDYWRA